MIALALWILLGIFLAATAAVTMLRYRPARAFNLNSLPPCSIIVPVKGASPFLADNMRALAAIEPFRGEILLSIANEDDPAIDIVRPIISDHPNKMMLMIGEAGEFSNPKLRNVAKAYRSCREDVILFLDDSVQLNVRIFSELIDTLGRTAVVTAAPLGSDVENLPAEFEAATCAYLVRLEMFLELFGAAATFGNALAFRKRDLEAVGGLSRLTEGPCEDNALSKALRASGKRVTLIRSCTTRRIGRRRWIDVYARHVRWKKCVKHYDLIAFCIEPFIGGLCFNLLGSAAFVRGLGTSVWLGVVVSLTVCYGIEALVHIVCGWHARSITPFAWFMRDLAHPLLTIVALFSKRIIWRGESIEMHTSVARTRSERQN